jgi:transposase
MTRPLVSDGLWAAVAPLLPEEPPKPKGGRPRCDDRRALEGIVFVLWSGIGWERLPREAFGCTGMTCWRRLRDWQEAGVLGRLHRVLLERLAAANELDWSRASIDSASIPAKGGARRPRRRSARTPRTAGGRARSATSLSMPAARRSALS